MSQTKFLDNLVKEYLVHRGLSNTLKSFEQEKQIKNLGAEKILESLQHSISVLDLQSFMELWNHLDSAWFSKLELQYATCVKKMRSGMLKLYLVTASSSGKLDKIQEFFHKMSPELLGESEWKEWFYFPFCKCPEEYPTFQLYFSKQWQDTLLLSLRNFLLTINHCAPTPTLYLSGAEFQRVNKLNEEIASLKAQIAEPKTKPQSINSIDICPLAHIADDFYIIASETPTSFDGNISGDSGRDSGSSHGSKRRSGSVGRYWN